MDASNGMANRNYYDVITAVSGSIMTGRITRWRDGCWLLPSSNLVVSISYRRNGLVWIFSMLASHPDPNWLITQHFE